MFSLLCHIFVFALSAVSAMAAHPKPTVVIVPGSWQLPAVWDEFRAVLSRAGHQSYHVNLPSVGGTELPLTGLPEDVAAVRNVVGGLADSGDEIVLLCHSSGGVVGSNAVEGYDMAARQAAGKQGGVVRIVYLSAFMLPKDQSLLGMLGGVPLPWMVVDGDRVTGDPEMMPEIGFNDLPADKKAEWAQQVTWTSAALFAAPSQFEPWNNGIPGAYIFQTLDNALPYDLQQAMAQQLQLGPNTRTATIASGHCGFLSMPERLLGALKQVIGGN
ncbi:Alpha/beta hydrolase fold-1 [Chaetomidium leptoderma]|uniref:Alpha/beta hydrolase fold-1 n=1 Tax=Chaetomidium leptoderma TaxID=669021 RepID=A0AAN6ZZK6_9PEZI|nr:Alpha/beta hydrolase fold-1 [Chaetomidium leptoderma]